MWLNSYSVRVCEGKESNDGYVELTHGQQYSMVLANKNNTRCDAHVEVDGKHIGTWRVEAKSHIRIDRPAHDTGRLTFYLANSTEARSIGLPVGSSELGLIRVTFTPEVIRQVNTYWVTPSWPVSPVFPDAPYIWSGTSSTSRQIKDVEYTSCYAAAAAPEMLEAGGTGISGQSNQVFGEAYAIEYDMARQTVIHIRLVGKSTSNKPRPLTAFSTPIPPAVNW